MAQARAHIGQVHWIDDPGERRAGHHCAGLRGVYLATAGIRELMPVNFASRRIR
jgi:hypothetical protein